MRRNRVVDDGLDTMVCEMLLQGLAFGVADDKQMPDGIGPRGSCGDNKLRVEG
jgi:hypothetical protein